MLIVTIVASIFFVVALLAFTAAAYKPIDQAERAMEELRKKYEPPKRDPRRVEKDSQLNQEKENERNGSV